MNIEKLFPSKWLKAADLEGRRITAVIGEVKLETMDGKQGKHDEPVLYFRHSKSGKGLILNQTNAFAIAEHYGPETDAWVGKSIELYATQIKIKGEMHDVIRVVGKKKSASVGQPRDPASSVPARGGGPALDTEKPVGDDRGLWEPNA